MGWLVPRGRLRTSLRNPDPLALRNANGPSPTRPAAADAARLAFVRRQEALLAVAALSALAVHDRRREAG